MNTDRKITSTFGSSQIAYPVGESKDSYSINSWYRENLETGIITVTHQLVKNNSYSDWREGMDKSSKYKEVLYQGKSYNECAKIVDDIVLAQGEWRQIPGDAFNRELMFTLNK